MTIIFSKSSSLPEASPERCSDHRQRAPEESREHALHLPKAPSQPGRRVPHEVRHVIAVLAVLLRESPDLRKLQQWVGGGVAVTSRNAKHNAKIPTSLRP